MLRRVLAELERPQTLAQVAARVGVEPGVLWGMLETLQQGGYVGLAYSESPACGTSCAGCSLKNLCPAVGSETPPPTPVWRLTAKGRAALEQGL
ncbi:helix-turn-helix domain-containing protein [Deinococcota bacterium DY0809b]